MGTSPLQSELHKYLNKDYIPTYIYKHRGFAEDLLNNFSLIAEKDADRTRFSAIFQKMKESEDYDSALLVIGDVEMERCIASLLGLAICDALGASTEFSPFIKEGHAIIQEGFKDIEHAINEGYLEARAGKVGIWTDDCSMALCMADSLIYYKYRFDQDTSDTCSYCGSSTDSIMEVETLDRSRWKYQDIDVGVHEPKR